MNDRMLKQMLAKEFAKQNGKYEPCTEHMEETAEKARTVFRAATSGGMDGRFSRLLVSQIRCTGKVSIGLQALIFVFGFLAVRFMEGQGTVGELYMQERGGILILCISAVTAAWSSVPALARSYRCRMAEAEGVTYFSLSRLMLARIIVCIGGAAIIASLIGGAVWFEKFVSLDEVAAYLILPFFTSMVCIFYVMRKKKGNFVFGSTAALAIVAAAFLLWRKAAGYGGEGPESLIVWMLCGVMLLLWIWEICKIYRKGFYFEQEGEETQWNYV